MFPVSNVTFLNRLRFILNKFPAIKCASQALCVTSLQLYGHYNGKEDTGEENSAILYLHIEHGMGNIEGSQGVNITFLTAKQALHIEISLSHSLTDL